MGAIGGGSRTASRSRKHVPGASKDPSSFALFAKIHPHFPIDWMRYERPASLLADDESTFQEAGREVVSLLPWTIRSARLTSKVVSLFGHTLATIFSLIDEEAFLDTYLPLSLGR